MAILNNQTIPRRFPLSFHEMELVGEDCKAQPQTVVDRVRCSAADTFSQVETEGTGLQGAAMRCVASRISRQLITALLQVSHVGLPFNKSIGCVGSLHFVQIQCT